MVFAQCETRLTNSRSSGHVVMPTLANSGPNSGPNGLGPAGVLLAESVGGGLSDLLDAAFAALGVGKGRDMKATTRLAMPIPQYLSAKEVCQSGRSKWTEVLGGEGTCSGMCSVAAARRTRAEAPAGSPDQSPRWRQQRSASDNSVVGTDRCCTHLFSCIQGAHFAPQTHVIAA